MFARTTLNCDIVISYAAVTAETMKSKTPSLEFMACFLTIYVAISEFDVS